MRRFSFSKGLCLTLSLLCVQCASSGPNRSATTGDSSGSPAASSSGGLPQIINVSAYDPKERQRDGQSYSASDVSALRLNGASGLIARVGKGGRPDEKCSTFLTSADRAGLLIGVYYRVQRHLDAMRQADQMVDRALSLSRSRDWQGGSLLLCGDYDGDLSLSAILAFMDRVESRTGVVPVAYLENSPQLKLQTRAADAATRSRLLRAPYWLALYSHESGAGPLFPAPGSPQGLIGQYDLWSRWSLWQYGGVDWDGGASRPKVYNHGRYRFPLFFGNLDRPVERNVFNGSQAQLQAFWARHGMKLR
jgi:GH25 family lysozyme M1 (1,4-beta-N-acetylmuramidase)